MKDYISNIHFVGIGGVGMAGIAEVCLSLGYVVTGSDINLNPTITRLQSLGAIIQIGHNAKHVTNSGVVVVSTAINADNEEVNYAREHRIPIIPRAAMLAELMRMQFGIAIAGTHGKTTTTSLTAAMLTEDGLDPTFVIGGKLKQAGVNARLGSSKYLVAEADESDASFLHLSPMMSVITNIDKDHMETYQGDYQNLENTFIEFIHRLPFYGTAIVCIDDMNIQNMLPKLSRKIFTYGLSTQADVKAYDIVVNGLTMRFMVKAFDLEPFAITLALPGEHNVLNSLAAITVALELDVKITSIQKSLANFGGIGRRFEVFENITISDKKITLVDDYGHHPAELEATLKTAKNSFPNKRIVLIFQPHRYSRTRDLFDDFVQTLQMPDLLILTETYSAGEKSLIGFDSKSLLQSLRMLGKTATIHVENLTDLDALTNNILLDDDIVLVMGAGDIGQVAKRWSELSD